MKNLFVSIVIPTYNRTSCVINLLTSLNCQDYRHFEILIIDQSDAINEIIVQYICKIDVCVKYLLTNLKGRSLAKNVGIKESVGNVVIFCDDDIIVPENFITTHIQALNRENVGAVSCRLVEEGDPTKHIKRPLWITPYGKLRNQPFSTWSGYVTSLNGGNMSFKKTVLEKVGYFEELFIGTSMVEEPDIAFRVIKNNYKIYFDASITVNHFPQFNGNKAVMTKEREKWFYDFFYNLLFFYQKYGRLLIAPLIFFYCIGVLAKHSLLYNLSIFKYPKIAKGLLLGFINGNRIYNSAKKNPYYTAYRSKVKIIYAKIND